MSPKLVTKFCQFHLQAIKPSRANPPIPWHICVLVELWPVFHSPPPPYLHHKAPSTAGAGTSLLCLCVPTPSTEPDIGHRLSKCWLNKRINKGTSTLHVIEEGKLSESNSRAMQYKQNIIVSGLRKSFSLICLSCFQLFSLLQSDTFVYFPWVHLSLLPWYFGSLTVPRVHPNYNWTCIKCTEPHSLAPAFTHKQFYPVNPKVKAKYTFL